MKLSFSSVIQLLFPSPYTRKLLDQIPAAPEPYDSYIFALYDYHSLLGKKLIYDIKSKKDRFVSEYVAEHMSLHVKEYLSDQYQFSYFTHPLVIPVPLTPKQYRSRGFNQVSSIARCLAKQIGGTYLPVIIKQKETHKQALIKNKYQRFLNVRGCFQIQEQNTHLILKSDVIIIDDLVTTGATLQEMKKVLEKNGARNVIAITVGH